MVESQSSIALLPAPSTILTTIPQTSPVEVSDSEHVAGQIKVQQNWPAKTMTSIDAIATNGTGESNPSATGIKEEDDEAGSDVEDDDSCGETPKKKGKAGGKEGKSRRELPAGAVQTLKKWLLSPEHFTHPYPTPQDQIMLMQQTGIDKKQLKNWFTNARRRIWKPMLKKQLEQGKLAATNAGGGGVAVVGSIGGVPGLIMAQHSVQTASIAQAANIQKPSDVVSGIQHNSHPAHVQQSFLFGQQQGHQQQQQQFNVANQQAAAADPGSGNAVVNGSNGNNPFANLQNFNSAQQGQYFNSSNDQPPQFNQQQMPNSNSIGNLAPILSAGNINSPHRQQQQQQRINKTDSHAVLMELFARDQELVRQASEGAWLMASQVANAQQNQQGQQQQLGQQQQGQQQQGQQQQGQQQQMKKLPSGASSTFMGSSGSLFQGANANAAVPTLNSWPHFSSVSSLNNLGTLAGVKSITNMSGADLASQGNLNKKGNLAQVKSVESMGRTDSYAFLEVFFDDRNGGSMGASRGVKREREEDNDVGLSLDDEQPPPTASSNTPKPNDVPSSAIQSPNARTVPPPSENKENAVKHNNENLKRAYDDALAARGLISVSRSSENLKDLAIPATMQRTLSQEFLRHQQMGAVTGQQFGSYGFQSGSMPVTGAHQKVQVNGTQHNHQNSTPFPSSQQQYPGQNPGQQQQNQQGTNSSSNQHNSGVSQQCQNISQTSSNNHLSDPSMSSASVEVPITAKCALCHCTNVDTQLRPCGHMFHGRCLKPSLQNAMGPPTCPIDGVPMQSAVLAVPTEEGNTQTNVTQSKPHNNAQGNQQYASQSCPI